MDTKIVELDIQSPELQKLIYENWNIRKANFGTEDSSCDEYDIYFDEGIKVRTVAGKAFNIV